MDGLTADELAYIAGKAGLSERLVLDTARETVERFCAAWQRDRQDLPLTHHATASLEAHLKTLPIARI